MKYDVLAVAYNTRVGRSPHGERGLKFFLRGAIHRVPHVAPRTGSVG